jgi:hypothetical protein
MHSFHHNALDFGIPTSPVFDSLTPHQVLKRFIQKCLAFVCTTTGLRTKGFVYHESRRIEPKSSATAEAVFVFSGVRCKNFEKT